jgi:hypothetical protein
MRSLLAGGNRGLADCHLFLWPLLLGDGEQAACGVPWYAVRFVIMAQTMRAILLARATAPTLRGRRSRNSSSHGARGLAPWLGDADHHRRTHDKQLS